MNHAYVLTPKRNIQSSLISRYYDMLLQKIGLLYFYLETYFVDVFISSFAYV